MFAIALETNLSEPNRIVKNVEPIITLNGELKQETSIIDPEFIIAGDLDDFVGCNYCTISEFGRSYFVRDITSVRAGLVRLRCHVDVLSSFANEILSNRAIIRRQETDWNLYLNDGSFRVYQNPDVVTHPFPQGFTAKEFVLSVAGSAPTS